MQLSLSSLNSVVGVHWCRLKLVFGFPLSSFPSFLSHLLQVSLIETILYNFFNLISR